MLMKCKDDGKKLEHFRFKSYRDKATLVVNNHDNRC